MPDLIRPEAREALRRWGESLLAAVGVGLGLYWALSGVGAIRWIGWAVTVLGLAWGWSALQRARFSWHGTHRRSGPGVVQVVEGEIRFFGPRGGGFVAIDAICALSLSADGGFWLIEGDDGRILVIARAATGAEALFDAFARLPGLDMGHLLHTLVQDNTPRARVIWRRTPRALLTRPRARDR